MKWAERCLSSLRNSSVSCDVMVIDNNSTDGTQNFIHTHFPEVELIENKKNLGFGQANNIGLQRVLDENYEYAYLLNQDAWVMPDTLEKLIDISKTHPEYGVLSPMQLKAISNHFEDKFREHVLFRHQKFSPLLIEDMYFGRKKDIYEVSFVMAAHWLITARCISMVGGFSPTFFHYGEDRNYLNRTNFWNFKIGIVPAAQGVHDRGDSKWSQAKVMYVNEYIRILISSSNPLHKEALGKQFTLLLKTGIRARKKDLIKYSFRLMKEKDIVESNFAKSLNPRAFLL